MRLLHACFGSRTPTSWSSNSSRQMSNFPFLFRIVTIPHSNGEISWTYLRFNIISTVLSILGPFSMKSDDALVVKQPYIFEFSHISTILHCNLHFISLCLPHINSISFRMLLNNGFGEVIGLVVLHFHIHNLK